METFLVSKLLMCDSVYKLMTFFLVAEANNDPVQAMLEASSMKGTCQPISLKLAKKVKKYADYNFGSKEGVVLEVKFKGGKKLYALLSRDSPEIEEIRTYNILQKKKGK